MKEKYRQPARAALNLGRGTAAKAREYTEFTFRAVYVRFGRWLNDTIRGFDRKFNNIEPRSGHPRGIFVLATAVLLVLIAGPTVDAVIHPFVASNIGAGAWFEIQHFLVLSLLVLGTIALWQLSVWVTKVSGAAGLQNVQSGVFGVASLIVYFFGESAVEADNTIYRHVFLWLLWLLIPTALFARFLINKFIRMNLGNDGYELLVRSPLMVDVNEAPALSKLGTFQALITALMKRPLMVLLLPSIAVVFISFFDPTTRTVRLVAALVFVFSWLFLSVGRYWSQWDLLIVILRSWFFVGGSMLVSIAIIGLAIGRVADVHYVTTMLQGYPVSKILLASYLCFWWYDYWVTRVGVTKLLSLFKDGQSPEDDPDWKISFPNQSLEADELVILGGSRFLVFDDDRESGRPYRIFRPSGLLELIGSRLPSDDKRRLTLETAERAYHGYLSFLNAFLAFAFVAVVLFFRIFLEAGNPRPILLLEESTLGERNAQEQLSQDPCTDSSEDTSLACLLTRQTGKNASGRAILLAASGGGTRAALYTASLLCGLRQLQMLEDVVLVSGVSGGSAALAYFAQNRNELSQQECLPGLSATNNAEGNFAWQKFFDVMGSPFIDEVIEGAFETRIWGSTTNGQLLVESFARNFRNPGEKLRPITEVKELGIVLNTTLVGHPSSFGWELCERALSQIDSAEQSVHAGGRLVFSNLASAAFFPSVGSNETIDCNREPHDSRLEYKVIDGRFRIASDAGVDSGIPLSTAAALSANFPPFFSNSGINVAGDRTVSQKGEVYWVTDGGASENRGIVSLLRVLATAVDELVSRGNAIPNIHVLIADAGSNSVEYDSSSRGISALFNAASGHASEYYWMLHDYIERRLAQQRIPGPRRVHLQHLRMPGVFTNGGIGTHWKLPRSVVLTSQHEKGRGAESVIEAKLDKEMITHVIQSLHHAGDPSNNLTADEQCRNRVANDPLLAEAKLTSKIANLLCADIHQQAWLEYQRMYANLDQHMQPAKPCGSCETKPVQCLTESDDYVVYFEHNQAVLGVENENYLSVIADRIQGAGATKIEIVGHADASGELQFNKDLSEQRAKNVEAFLAHELDVASVASWVGLGETAPITSAPEKNRYNRRVEIILHRESSNSNCSRRLLSKSENLEFDGVD